VAIIDTPHSFWRILSSQNFAIVDLLFCLLIVAYIFFPSTLSQVIDFKTLALIGAAAFILLIGVRGAGAGIVAIAAVRLEEAAKNSTSAQKAALLNYAKNTLVAFLVSFAEGVLWCIILFLPIYALFWFVGNPLEPTGKEVLTQLASETFLPFENAKIVHFPDSSAKLAFFSLALLFAAASYFALFVVKKVKFSWFETMMGEESTSKNFVGSKEALAQYRKWLNELRNET